MATLGIIAYHVSYLLNFAGEQFPEYFINWSHYATRISMFAIPAFFISSGALLSISDLKRRSIMVFYKDKLKKLLIPFFVFYFPALFLLLFHLAEKKSNIFVPLLILPFWFVPFLLTLYFIYPALWYFLVLKRIRPRLFLIFIFIFAVGYYVLSVYWTGWPFNNSVLGLYIFFFALGMVLRFMILFEKREWLKKINLVFWSMLALAFYFTIGLISPKEGLLNYQFIYGPVVFLLLFYYFNHLYRLPLARIIEKIGKNSLYFYLIHFYILVLLISLIKSFNLFYINPIIIFIALFFFGFLITYILVFGGQRFLGNYIKKYFNYFNFSIGLMKRFGFFAFRCSKKSIKNILFRKTA